MVLGLYVGIRDSPIQYAETTRTRSTAVDRSVDQERSSSLSERVSSLHDALPANLGRSHAYRYIGRSGRHEDDWYQNV